MPINSKENDFHSIALDYVQDMMKSIFEDSDQQHVDKPSYVYLLIEYDDNEIPTILAAFTIKEDAKKERHSLIRKDYRERIAILLNQGYTEQQAYELAFKGIKNREIKKVPLYFNS